MVGKMNGRKWNGEGREGKVRSKVKMQRHLTHPKI